MGVDRRGCRDDGLDGALDAQAQTGLLDLDFGQAGVIENGGKLAQQIGIDRGNALRRRGCRLLALGHEFYDLPLLRIAASASSANPYPWPPKPQMTPDATGET